MSLTTTEHAIVIITCQVIAAAVNSCVTRTVRFRVSGQTRALTGTTTLTGALIWARPIRQRAAKHKNKHKQTVAMWINCRVIFRLKILDQIEFLYFHRWLMFTLRPYFYSIECFPPYVVVILHLKHILCLILRIAMDQICSCSRCCWQFTHLTQASWLLMEKLSHSHSFPVYPWLQLHVPHWYVPTSEHSVLL